MEIETYKRPNGQWSFVIVFDECSWAESCDTYEEEYLAKEAGEQLLFRRKDIDLMIDKISELTAALYRARAGRYSLATLAFSCGFFLYCVIQAIRGVQL